MSLKRHYTDHNRDSYDGNKRKKTKSDISYFQCRNRGHFDKAFPSFRKPAEIGFFSTDINLKFCDSKQSCKHYIKPENPHDVNFDLRKGYKDMIRKDENEKTYIDNILKWILLHPDRFVINNDNQPSDRSKRNLHTDFICWRGLITKLLCTPYENREDWKISVILYDGTYYMCEYDTEKKIMDREKKTERDDEMCCWGWKFETFLTADTPDGDPDTESPFNNTEAYVTVVRSRLNKHSIVFPGEVDAVQTDSQGKKSYVEFKVTRELTHPRQMVNFKRYKLLKWWAQSYLVGISTIVAGYRDDDGVVHRLEDLDVPKIPEKVKDVKDPWQPNVCFNFLDQILDFIKENVKTDNPRVAHLLQWSSGNDVTCSKLREDSEYCFLPDWYTKPT